MVKRNAKWLERWPVYLEDKYPEYEHKMPSHIDLKMKKLKGTVVTYDNCNDVPTFFTLIINLLNSIPPEYFPPGPTRESTKK